MGRYTILLYIHIINQSITKVCFKYINYIWYQQGFCTLLSWRMVLSVWRRVRGERGCMVGSFVWGLVWFYREVCRLCRDELVGPMLFCVRGFGGIFLVLFGAQSEDFLKTGLRRRLKSCTLQRRFPRRAKRWFGGSPWGRVDADFDVRRAAWLHRASLPCLGLKIWSRFPTGVSYKYTRESYLATSKVIEAGKILSKCRGTLINL